MSALAHQQQMHFMPPPVQKQQTTLFVGSISGGITDAFLNQLLSVRLQSIGHRYMYSYVTKGMRAHKVVQTSNNTSEQTAGLRLR